jgi:outer membrane protein assembly factor BamA
VLSIIVIFFLLFFCSSAHAQQDKEPAQEVIKDTVLVKKNSYVVTKDSVYFIDHDTVFYVKDTLQGSFEEVLNEEDYKKEKDFYRNLKKRLGKRKATKELFDLLFDVSDRKKKPKNDSLAHIPKRYDGKIVGNISIKQIDIFGPKVTDTTGQPKTGIARFFNKMHVNTRDRVIRNNLLIREGDFINQHKIADNERILRLLKFIKDARILIQPRASDSDTVDLLILTQDVMSLSGSLEPEGLTEATIHVNDNNILGTGHQLDNAILIEPEEKQYLG